MPIGPHQCIARKNDSKSNKEDNKLWRAEKTTTMTVPVTAMTATPAVAMADEQQVAVLSLATTLLAQTMGSSVEEDLRSVTTGPPHVVDIQPTRCWVCVWMWLP